MLEIWEIILALSLAILGSGSLVGLLIQNRIQKLRSIEEKLREERREVYAELLMPFIQIFTTPKEPEKVMEHVKSLEYKKISFELTLLGSDEVIRAYGNLMHHIYHHSSGNGASQQNVSELMKLWGKLLLEIRKSLGNDKTKLTEKDMLRHIITDIDRLDL